MTFFDSLFKKKEDAKLGIEKKKEEQAIQALSEGNRKRAKNLTALAAIASRHKDLVATNEHSHGNAGKAHS